MSDPNKIGDLEVDVLLVKEGLTLETTVEEDLRFPATLIRQGATTKPDFDITELALMFPDNAETEIAYMVAQMPHSWKAGSGIEPHVHIKQEGSDQAVFYLEYKWLELGEAIPAAFTTITLDQYVFDYVSGDLHQMIYSSVPIDGSGKTESSILLMRLYRANDDDVTGDVAVYEFDIHYQVEKLGKNV